MLNKLMRFVMRRVPSLSLVIVCIGTAAAPSHAQSTSTGVAAVPPGATSERMLTEAEIIARYRHCPQGYYSGPQPGKARYTKDKFIWAVTPAFAAKFCMPPEFISTELKGAEAVAYRMVGDDSGENCGFGDKASVCSKGTNHRFEIYYPTGLLPKKRELPYFHAAHLPSALLLTGTDKEIIFGTRRAKEKPRPGALGVYEESFGVLALDPKKGSLPLGGTLTLIYYEEAFEGLDYVAFELMSGFTRLRDWPKGGVRQMAIVMSKSGDKRAHYKTPLGDFEVVMPLPARMADAMTSNDIVSGNDLVGLAKNALQDASSLKAK